MRQIFRPKKGRWMATKRRSHLLGSVLLLQVRSIGGLAKLVLLGKLLRKNAQVLDECLRSVDNSLARSNFAIGLNTQLELGSQRMGDLINHCQYPSKEISWVSSSLLTR